jgi:hypothetical protein
VFPEIGYCQGMNYIVATMFTFLKDAELTFDLFVTLIVSQNLVALFRP